MDWVKFVNYNFEDAQIHRQFFQYQFFIHVPQWMMFREYLWSPCVQLVHELFYAFWNNKLDEIYTCCQFKLRLYHFLTNLIVIQFDRNLDLQLIKKIIIIKKNFYFKKPSKILAIIQYHMRNRKLI